MATIETTNLFLKPFTSKLPDPPKENVYNCSVCSSTAIYKCPKCLSRTCSLKCSKTHKEENKCDGQRTINDQQTWQKIQGYSNFNEETTSIEDQQFLYNIRQRKRDSTNENKDSPNKKLENTLENKNLQNQENTNKHKFSQSDYSLLKSAQFRRIWILPSNNSSKDFGGSRIEQFSDTIFWKCTIKFACRVPIEQNLEIIESPKNNLKIKSLVDYELEDEEDFKDSDGISDDMNKKIVEEGEILPIQQGVEKQLIDSDNEVSGQHDGEIDIDVCPNQDSLSSLKWLSYTVQNIPESIRVCTLLRQFLQPKPNGTVISKSQLDMDFLQPFILPSKQIVDPANNSDINNDCGSSSHLQVYSEVVLPLGNEVDEVKSENECQIDAELRLKIVVGHPCFVVFLRRENEFGEFEFPMMGEVEQALLHAERERTVTIKDRPKWQNRDRNGGGRGFRGDRPQYNNKSRQHNRGRRDSQQQKMTEHNRHQLPPNGQWQQQPSYGPVYNYSSNQHQYHFHPYMPSTFIPPHLNQGPPNWNGQEGSRNGFGR